VVIQLCRCLPIQTSLLEQIQVIIAIFSVWSRTGISALSLIRQIIIEIY